MILAALWKNDLRHYLITINLIAFAILVIYVVRAGVSPKRAQEEGEKSPANLTPFLADEDLEGRRLERVQGWALVFAAVIAIALPIYWLREPTRQDQSKNYFDKNSAARGAILFASPGSEEYEAASSLQCANCHGDKGQGGTAKTSIDGVSVLWKAPPLNTELLRFRQDAACDEPVEARPSGTICEVTDIITYGRPGTPMQGWGVAGGGPKNDQAIADLVSFIRSIQLSPAESQKQAADAVAAAKANSGTCPEYMACSNIAVADARSKVESTTKTRDDKLKAVLDALKLAGDTPPEQITAQCKTVSEQVTQQASKNISDVDATLKTQGTACSDYSDAQTKVDDAQAALDWALEWQTRRANVSDGQLLFEYACARCHTAGWSVFDPASPPSKKVGVGILGLEGGGGGTGGGIGFNLRDGDLVRRFGTDSTDPKKDGFELQVAFVKQGSLVNQPYGFLGLGSGRMPGFGSMLSDEQVRQIVAYERYCLDSTTFLAVTPACDTSPTRRDVPPAASTTTTAAKG